MIKYKILFFIFFNIICYSQNNYKVYYKFINKAFATNEKDSTIYYYKEAFKCATPFYEDTKNLSYVYYTLGDLENSKKYLFKSILLGYQFETDKKNAHKSYIIDYKLGYVDFDSIVRYDIFLATIVKENLKKIRKLRSQY